MKVLATENFFKKRDRLISKEIITLDEYKETRDKFKTNPKDEDIRPHKIDCGKSHNIISISIVNKGERILAYVKKCHKTKETFAIFSWIGKHREYEKVIKNHKNCKSIFVNCDEINQILEQEKKEAQKEKE